MSEINQFFHLLFHAIDMSSYHRMNKDRSILIHDVASLTFLAPFSVLCLADVLFAYTVYPMFLTHALTTYMSYDLMWRALTDDEKKKYAK